jgi:enamine deaminase RidA (YjgF/YER057c/UK114 family)
LRSHQGRGQRPESLKIQLRRAFSAIKDSLIPSGADFSQVVQMQTFHNCKTPNCKGDFNAQLEALIAVKSEFMKPPYSTWTAICVDRHYSDNAVVVIEVTAFAPTGHW